MNRRMFCKLAAGSALMAALMPQRLLGAVRCGQRCAVSVVRCECFDDLQSKFASDPDGGACPKLKAGMNWKVTGTEMSMPKGMCPKAWEVIRASIQDKSTGCSGGDENFVCCPDGIRPVIFKITYINR